MRFADVIGLSLGALRQQKARTVMTTLGVVFGAFVLVVSLSLGEGVQLTIKRESYRNRTLRGIDIYPEWGLLKPDVPEDQLQVAGTMSEERRQRLRQTLREQRLNASRRGWKKPLNLELLHDLAALEHVEAVTPSVQLGGWAALDGMSHPALVCSSAQGNDFYRRRLVAGEFFHAPDDRSAVVSEYLCYQFGLTSDAEIASLIGRKLRVEFRTETQTAGLHVYLTKADGAPQNRDEQVAMEKLRSQLPTAMDRLDLTQGDKAALRAALQGTPHRPADVWFEEFTVVGVLRQVSEDERKGNRDRYNIEGDVVLPEQTAVEMVFKRPDAADYGVDYATLTVDHEENVRGVAERVRALGLQANAPIEYIDHERLIYLLIFSTMTCVAGVALLIAALGIANTMLMSVLERTREIGIFKAVGAGDGTVQLIFLIEGALIGLVGGALGLLLAWAGSFPADAWIRSMISRDLKIDLKESLFAFPPWLTVGVVVFAVVVTTLAAVYPARRAARVEPLKALRHE